MPAIALDKLSKVYRGKRGLKVDALNSLSLEIAQGEIFGFLGPNGAGKSTTIKCLMGLIRPTGGTATIMGEPIGSVASRAKIGFLPENPAFYDYLSAEEYLSFVGRAFKMPEALLARRTDKTLKQLELWDARKRPMRGYSKGMVQRVGLAQTLIHDPEVYILDEPMSGLDPIGRALVKKIILDLKARGKTVFFSSHIISDVEAVCDRVGIIVKGELKALEDVHALMIRGVEGYIIKLSSEDQTTENVFVSKEKLATQIEIFNNENKNILLIEPQMKNLEERFLDIVSLQNGIDNKNLY